MRSIVYRVAIKSHSRMAVPASNNTDNGGWCSDWGCQGLSPCSFHSMMVVLCYLFLFNSQGSCITPMSAVDSHVSVSIRAWFPRHACRHPWSLVIEYIFILWLNVGRATAREHSRSSPYNMSFGMRPWYMRRVRVAANEDASKFSSVKTLWMPARSSTSALLTLSCRLVFRRRPRQRGWKSLSRFSCLAWVVQHSLVYRRVLSTQAWLTRSLVFFISWLFSHTRLLTFDIAAAALALQVLIFLFNERVGHFLSHVGEGIHAF